MAENKKKKKKKRNSGAGLALAFVLSLLFCVYAPLELYLTNISEFWMIPKMLVIPVAVVFLAVFAVLSIIFVVVNKINGTAYRVLTAVASGALVGMYVQGNFLIKNLPDINGVSIDWNSLPAERIKSIVAFVIPIIIFTVIALKIKQTSFEKAVKIASACISLLFAVTLTTLFITTDTSKELSLVSTVKNEFQMSEDKNYIVLILDALDSGYFKEALEKDGELKKELDGFTYYDDALAAYPYTTHAMPMIFSGSWYENDGSFSEYRVNALDNSPFINSLEQQGYLIGIYDKCELDMKESRLTGRYENCFPGKINYFSEYTYLLVLKMGGIKYAPWDLKQFSYLDLENYMLRGKVSNSNEAAFSWSDSTFYTQLDSDDPFTKTDEKCAKIIHLEGAHVPYRYDKNVNRISTKLGTYEQNVEACVTLTKRYIEKLKNSGVYDNSVIIIMGDHGYAGNDLKDEYNIKKRMNPAVLIKGINEKHAMKYSSAPISYTDLAEAFKKLANEEKGDDIFYCKENEERSRRMILFVFNKEDKLKEYVTDGKANDPDAMTATGNEYNIKK